YYPDVCLSPEKLMSPLRIFGFAAVFVAAGAAAQQYPTKSVTMYVPYAAGGPTDTVARVMAQSMAKPLGHTVIVEHKPRAGGMLFMSAIQTDILTVPYKGTGPAMNDLLGGQVDFMCDQTTNTTSQIKSGKVKVYGVTSLKRVDSLPEIPTLDEQGLKGFEVT